jgi:hypothetical protein
MGSLWRRIFGLDDNEVEVMKSGDINYTVIKQRGEVLMAIVQPPTVYSGKTDVAGKISIFDASGNAQVDRSREIKFGEPFILFNPNNKAGLQLQNAVKEAKKILPNALRNESDVKVDVDKLDEAHAVPMASQTRISIGTSSVLQVNQDNSLDVLSAPNIRIPTMQLFLKVRKAYTQYMEDNLKMNIIDIWEDEGMRELLKTVIEEPQNHRLSNAQLESLRQLDKNLRFDISELKIAKMNQDNDAIQKIGRRIDGYLSFVMNHLSNIVYT